MRQLFDALIFFGAVVLVFHLADEWLPAAAAAAAGPQPPANANNYRFG